MAWARHDVFDYSQPLSTWSNPPQLAWWTRVERVRFGSAAFQDGDYAKAFELTDQAIQQMPNDAALHEFRA